MFEVGVGSGRGERLCPVCFAKTYLAEHGVRPITNINKTGDMMNIDDVNYFSDHRVTVLLRTAYEISDDEREMGVFVYSDGEDGCICEEVLWVPIKWQVCPTCRGRGSHVSPSVDSGGLTQDDLDRDPGFAEDYFSGVYMQTCNGCRGRRVVPTPNLALATPEDAARIKRQIESDARDARERARELRYGY